MNRREFGAIAVPAADFVCDAFARGLRPDAQVTLSEWADRERVLSKRASNESGPWRTSRTPYLKEPMDCVSDPAVRRVVLKWGSQLGKSEGLVNNVIGWIIDQRPGPILMVQPTLDAAKDYSVQRIAALIEETPCLRDKVKDPRSRDSGNTQLTKVFPGGILRITGANSAVGLRSMPAKYRIYDETSEFPSDVSRQGDPVALGEARGRSFGASGKRIEVSSPTIEGACAISAAYEETDQRQLWVPCPHCREMQVLRWSQVKWKKGKPSTVRYECEFCGGEIRNHQKTWMLERHQWRAKFPEIATPGFQLSGLYSPVGFYSWAQAAEDREKAEGKPAKLQVFINTVLAETWQERGEAPEWKRLYERRESYKIGTVPAGGLLLTCGVDVQGDRIEGEVKAWGRGLENWSIDYFVLAGDPKKDPRAGDPERELVWNQLSERLSKLYRHEWGADMPILLTGIDSGYATQHVYRFCRKNAERVMAVKGQDTGQLVLGQPLRADLNRKGRLSRRGLKLWPVGTRLAKSEFYGWLRLDRNSEEDGGGFPAGYCHHPQYAEEYFRQITAEEIQKKIVRGYPRFMWEKTRLRNEALDTHVYNRAPAARLGVDHFTEEHWQALEDELRPRPDTPRPTEPEGGGPGRDKLVIRSKFMER